MEEGGRLGCGAAIARLFGEALGNFGAAIFERPAEDRRPCRPTDRLLTFLDALYAGLLSQIREPFTRRGFNSITKLVKALIVSPGVTPN